MRPILITATTLALALMAAGAAFAASPRAAPPPPPAADELLPPIAEDQAQADAMARQLAALDDRIGADEARMTILRDAELARENARIRAIRPAMAFGPDAYTPR